MEKINVKAVKPYNVLIGQNILKAGALDLTGAKRAMIVTDENVKDLYLDKIIDLIPCGVECRYYIMGAGEFNKSPETVFGIIKCLSENNFDRKDVIIALGGGVVGDTAGFAASIFMRGIDFLQIPTTLLAAIDSSVGGKTAVNVGNVKNVAGTFHQPRQVIIDTDIIRRINEKLFLDGMGEGVKYAALSGGRLYDLIVGGDVKDNTEEFIKLCVECKADVVGKDEFENGYRRVLNLGHTIAHAIESLSKHSISHGVAVAIGLREMVSVSRCFGLTDKASADELYELTDSYFGGETYEYDVDEAIDVISKDKKCEGGKISVICPIKAGEVKTVRISLDELKSALRSINESKGK